MADEEDYESLIPEDTPMDGTGERPVVELSRTGEGSTLDNDTNDTNEQEDNGLPFQEELLEDAPARVTYIEYLKSPVIGLLVGTGNDQALLTAHQALLVQSPWFADTCAKFSNDVSVSLITSALPQRS
jgi:hypothetical protein